LKTDLKYLKTSVNYLNLEIQPECPKIWPEIHETRLGIAEIREIRPECLDSLVDARSDQESFRKMIATCYEKYFRRSYTTLF